MKKVVLVALACTVLALLLLPACGDEGVPTNAVAKVGDGVVTKAEFDRYMDQARKAATAQPGAPPFPSPGTQAYNTYAAQLVDYLVTQQLVTQEADKLKITVTDDEVNDRLQQLYQAYGGEKKVREILTQQGMTVEELEEQLRYETLGQKVYDDVTKDAKPGEDELRAYYEEHKAEFDTSEQRMTRHILVKDKATAEKIARELRADPSDANWKKLAKQYSVDEISAKKGGDLGPVQKGQMVAPFDKAVFGAKPNQIVGPVKTQFGWHVIEVTKVVKGEEGSFDKVKAQIAQMLSAQSTQKAYQDWLDKAKEEADIKYAPGYDPAELTKAPEPAPSEMPLETVSPAPSKTK